MRPTLTPGDGVIAIRSNRIRTDQIRVLPHPERAGFWLVKRVGQIVGEGADAQFAALSDNADAPGVVDSRRLGLVPVAGSYRVIWIRRAVAPPGIG